MRAQHDGSSATALCPFSITVEPMAAMLNCELPDDPWYTGIELQRFDDVLHGTGLAVLLARRDSRQVDVYRQPGLRLDRASYAIGAGLGEWQEAEIEPGRLEVSEAGTVAEIGLLDAAGRRVEVHVDDRGGKPRSSGALLAPVSAGVEHPTAMMLVWMPRFDLLHVRGRPPQIRIDGRVAATGRLPAAWLHRRHLVKVAASLAVVRLNPDHEGALPTAPAITGDATGITGIQAPVAGGGHRASLLLEPALPDLADLAEGGEAHGTWRVAVDEVPSLASGTWTARRVGELVELRMDSTAEWTPGPLPLLMRFVTRVAPVFRTWPRTYAWRGQLRLGDEPSLTAGWERTGPLPGGRAQPSGRPASR